MWDGIVFLFLQSESFGSPKERMMTEHLDRSYLLSENRKIQVRDNGQTNARVYDMFLKHNHIGASFVHYLTRLAIA